MQKSPLPLIVMALLVLTTATVLLGNTVLGSLSPETAEAAQTGRPDIPRLLDEFDFGIPAGNGYGPQRLAIDPDKRRLFSLNSGLASVGDGNTVSAIDLDSGEITELLRLNNRRDEEAFLPMPVDLQLDPFRPRLYALTGDPLADRPTTTLTIIDAAELTIIDTLPEVEAIAPGPDRLYLANDTRLWAVDPNNLTELAARELEPLQFNAPLRLDTRSERLYLGRGRPWSVEIFEAGTLTPAGSYPLTGDLIRLTVDEARQRLLIVESDGEQVLLQTLDRDGQPQSDPPALTVTDNVFSSGVPLALAGDNLYLVADRAGTYQLQSITPSGLTLQETLSLPLLPNDLAADPETGLLYAAYSSPGSMILTIDPTSGPLSTINTAVDILDILADPDSERLYLLDDQGLLHIRDLTGYGEIEHVETGLDMLDRDNHRLAELSLDPSRNRLYVSGLPIRTIDTDSFDLMVYPDLRGQLTPDPTGPALYLTPPCQCRQEQCNTLILNAATMTGTETLFPSQNPLDAACVVSTNLDAENQLLYVRIDTGQPGSNSGLYFSVFDTQPPGPPRPLFTADNISYDGIVFDPSSQRAFAPLRRQDQSAIHRFERQGEAFTQTLSLANAFGQLGYDAPADRLYAVDETSLQQFDGDLTLLAEIDLPGRFNLHDFDPQNRHLYLAGPPGRMLVIAPSGGSLASPAPLPPLADSPRPPQLFVAPNGDRFHLENGQLFRSQDEDQSHRRLGRGLPGRPVDGLAVSPDYEQDQTLLAGVNGGGLYRSGDGGDTWLPTNQGLTDLRIQQIAFSPTFSQDQTIFLTTPQRGLFRSIDGGDNWVSLADTYAPDSFDPTVSHLTVSPTFADDGLLFLSHRELLRSDDGGSTWASTGLPPGFTAFSPDFAQDGLILSEGRWRSTDDGNTWQPAAAGLEQTRFGAQNIFFSPDFPTDQTVYLLLRSDFDRPATLQRSVDAGRTWQSLLAGLPADFELATATRLPNGDLYLGDADGELLTRSPDELDWGRPPLDLRQIELHDFAAGPQGTLYAANSVAGVFKSVDGGQTWNSVDFPGRANLSAEARLAVADDGTLFAAAGSALERSTDMAQTWTYLRELPPGLTVASLAVSPAFSNDGIVIAGGDFNQNEIARSVDGGDTWQTVFDGSPVEGSSDVSLLTFSPDFAMDRTIYAWLQQSGLLRSTDGGQNWSLVTGDRSDVRDYFGQSLAVSPNGARLYLGALDGRLLVSEDGGQSWRDLSPNLPDNRVWSSALALTEDGAIFLGTDIGIYRSLDGGQSWSRASDGLPIDPTQGTPPAIRRLQFSGDRLYAALADGGVFVSDDLGQSWRSTTGPS